MPFPRANRTVHGARIQPYVSYQQAVPVRPAGGWYRGGDSDGPGRYPDGRDYVYGGAASGGVAARDRVQQWYCSPRRSWRRTIATAT